MKPVISIIMGSKSDWATMQKTAEVLDRFGVAYEKKVVSAHRTPDLMFKHAEEARSRGIKVIIAGAGGAAHLPGMVAAKTTLPVIGVPVKSRALSGVDSLYSIVQMPGGVPVATMAIGEAGATNAALFALRQRIQRILHMFVPQPVADGNPEIIPQAALQRPFADVQRGGEFRHLVRALVKCLIQTMHKPVPIRRTNRPA